MNDSLIFQVNFPAHTALATDVQGDVTLYTLEVDWDEKQVSTVQSPTLTLTLTQPLVDIQYQWHPSCGFNRALQPDWVQPVASKLSSGCPIHCMYNESGINRITYALSDCVTRIERRVGVVEEGTLLRAAFTIPLDGTGKSTHYSVTLRVDRTPSRYEDAIRAVSAWWEQFYPPMNIPESARQTLYSFWYSFHQQVFADKVEAECARAASLGLKTVIVDDGWQTDDNSRGYAYCGDWQPTAAKIPDMAAHVARVHEMGLKYILWYSVPFVGIHSDAIRRFHGKTLDFDKERGAYTLDPRYPDVRAYLIDLYEQALRTWDLDGFKLDFIDSFNMGADAPAYAEGMDYVVLEDAVHRLMVDVRKALTAIKPDILIEFRQSYIGPVMREYGNMLRVSDCPAAPNTNRVGIVDLRLTSGNTPVHSDMLEWNTADRIENAVGQILNCIFGTVQISACLDQVPEDHLRAIRYWTEFMNAHTDLLQCAPIYAEDPQLLYPVVSAQKDGRAAIACYASNRVLNLPDADEILLFNATCCDHLVVCDDRVRTWTLTVRNCCGDVVRTEVIHPDGFAKLSIPVSGMAELKKN